jgi:hypothetical protein
MESQYLDHLKEQQSAIEGFIDVQRKADLSHAHVGLRITAQFYVHILEDALKTLSALIEYFELDPDTNK